MPRRSGGAKAQRRSVVLVFGESVNDARAIAHLTEALCPDLRGRLRARPKPQSLSRAASPGQVRSWIDRIAAAVDGYAEPVHAVLIHRDSDGPDPTGVLERETNTQWARAALTNGYAVVPVEEIEAWWLLFPTATEETRSSWHGTLSASPGDVDRINDPKKMLTDRTRRGNVRHAYSEADSPKVAEQVAAFLANGGVPAGSSGSFDRFRVAIGKTCAS